MMYFNQLNNHTQQTYVTIPFHTTWPITHTSPTLYYSTYHSLHIQYLQWSSWGWTVTVRNMYSWHLCINKQPVLLHCVSRWNVYILQKWYTDLPISSYREVFTRRGLAFRCSGHTVSCAVHILGVLSETLVIVLSPSRQLPGYLTAVICTNRVHCL